MFERRLKLTKFWYATYCILNGLSYLVTMVSFVVIVRNPMSIVAQLPPDYQEVFPPDTVGLCALLVALLFGMFACVSFTLPLVPRKKSWYIVHVINLVFGLGSCVFTLICIYPFFQMIQKDMKAYYSAEAPPVGPNAEGPRPS